MTYNELYNTALCKLCLECSEVDDYRPADPMFIEELKQPIPNAIIIWLKTGERIIFINKEKQNEHI